MNQEEPSKPIFRHVAHHMSADTVIADLEELCSDEHSPIIVCSKRHHWIIQVVCSHGFVQVESITGTDLTQALIKAYLKMQETHKSKI